MTLWPLIDPQQSGLEPCTYRAAHRQDGYNYVSLKRVDRRRHPPWQPGTREPHQFGWSTGAVVHALFLPWSFPP